MGDVEQDGLVPVHSVRSVSKTTYRDDDVYPQVPFRSERFADSPLGVKFQAASTCEMLHGEVVGAG